MKNCIPGRGYWAKVSQADYEVIKERRINQEKEKYADRLETARKFIIVKLEVTEVECVK